jgi:hypothetical protein
MNEAMFDLPEPGFVDRTLTCISGFTASGAELMLIVERRPLGRGTSLRQAVTEHTEDAETRFRGYKVLFEQEIQIAGHGAIDVGSRWRSDAGAAIYTRRVHLALDNAEREVEGRVWLIFTCEVFYDERDAADAHLTHVIGSLKPR